MMISDLCDVSGSVTIPTPHWLKNQHSTEVILSWCRVVWPVSSSRLRQESVQTPFPVGAAAMKAAAKRQMLYWLWFIYMIDASIAAVPTRRLIPPDSAESFTAGGRLSPAGLGSAAGAATEERWKSHFAPRFGHQLGCVGGRKNHRKGEKRRERKGGHEIKVKWRVWTKGKGSKRRR